MSVVNPAILMLSMMNGNTGAGFKSRHSNNFITIGVISNMVVTLSINIEIIALNTQIVVINGHNFPWLIYKDGI